MANEMSEVVTRIGFIIFLEVRNWECNVEVSDILNRHDFVHFLQDKQKKWDIVFLLLKWSTAFLQNEGGH